jgi:hypothetical protein
VFSGCSDACGFRVALKPAVLAAGSLVVYYSTKVSTSATKFTKDGSVSPPLCAPYMQYHHAKAASGLVVVVRRVSLYPA